MGLLSKIWKKAKKAVTKPITKVFKGVARGIAKVGKAVMRGVSKLQKKLGPLGMIAMAVAMPYALQGLSSMIGTTAGPWGQATGLLARQQGTFLRAVGNIGNSIRNGYQIGSGKIGQGFAKIGEKFSQIGSTITDTITKTFQKFGGGGSGGAGGKENFWTRISKGARNLFNSAKSVVTGQPKVGTTGVKGWGGPFDYMQGNVSQMTSQQAVGLLESGAIEGAQLSGQTLGYATQSADKLVMETINKAAEKQISQLGPNSMRQYNDITNAYKANNTYINNQQALDAVLESQGTSYQGITDFDGVYNTDFSMTRDYKIAGPNLPNEPSSYTFTGEETFDNPVAKQFKYKDKVKRVKKAALGWAKDSLLAVQQDDIIQPDSYAWQPTAGAEFAGSIGASLSATDIKGATGSSSYANVFGDAAWEKLRAYHKHMNYQGST